MFYTLSNVPVYTSSTMDKKFIWIKNFFVVAAIYCLGMPHAKAGEAEVSQLDQILSNKSFKDLKIGPLVKVELEKFDVNQELQENEQTKTARQKAAKVYKLLMTDEMPDLKLERTQPIWLRGKHDTSSALFIFGANGQLERINITSTQGVQKVTTRSELRKADPNNVYKDIFGALPTGKFRRGSDRHITEGKVAGRYTWKQMLPKDVHYIGRETISVIGWGEHKDVVYSWNVRRGPSAEEVAKVWNAHKNRKPQKIGMERAVAGAYQALQKLKLPVSREYPDTAEFCYLCPPTPDFRPGSMKIWRAKDRMDVDGVKPVVGILVRFRIPGSFGRNTVIIDPQNGDVIYVSST